MTYDFLPVKNGISSPPATVTSSSISRREELALSASSFSSSSFFIPSFPSSSFSPFLFPMLFYSSFHHFTNLPIGFSLFLLLFDVADGLTSAQQRERQVRVGLEQVIHSPSPSPLNIQSTSSNYPPIVGPECAVPMPRLTQRVRRLFVQ